MRTLCGLVSAAAFAALALPRPACANDDLIRGLVGVGSAILNQSMQQRAEQHRENMNAARPYRGARAAPYAPAATGNDAQTRLQRAEIQRRLNLLGFNAGQPDGVYGARTRTAIAMFQKSLGRTPDGQLSTTEVSALYAATAQMAGTADAGQFLPPPETGGGSFPQLGRDTAADGTGGFPKLGGNGGAAEEAASAFPKLGGANAGSADAAGGFPSLGAPAQEGGAGAFPSVKTPPKGNAAQAMPSLGKPADDGGAQFPKIEKKAAETEDATMPALDPAPEQQDTFPETAGPSEDGGDTMPVLAHPSDEPNEDAAAKPDERPDGLQTTTLDAEIAKTVYATPDRQPEIGGARLGQAAADALKALKKAGFGDCSDDAVPFQCHRETDTLKDEVRVWSNGEDGVWAIRRAIAFKTPAPADFIARQFAETYPELMKAAVQSISSSAVCPGGRLPDQGITQIVERMRTVLEGPADAVPDDMLGYAQACPLFYMIGFDGEAEIRQVRLAFIDATPLIRRAVAARQKIEAEQKLQRDKLSRDLKL